MHRILLGFFGILFHFMAFGQSPVFQGEYIYNVNAPRLNEQFENYRVVELDALQLEEYLKYGNGTSPSRPLRLELGGEISWQLELMPKDIRSEDFELHIQTERGVAKIPKGDNITYQGDLTSPTTGLVRLTVNGHFIYGRVKTATEDWYIEPLKRFLPTAGDNQYLLYKASETKSDTKYKCAADDLEDHPGHNHHHDHHHDHGSNQTENRAVGQCYTTEIAIAADFQMFNQFGNTTDTENYMIGILNNVGTDYDDTFDDEIEFEIVTFFISTCSTCDPWTSSNDAADLLFSFRDWGNTGGFGGIFYDVATLWTNRNFAGNTLGVAWVGGLCTNLRYNTCQDFSSNANLLRVLQSHELGHNFNSNHDGSGGFIMSPNVSTSTTWSNQSINVISNFITNAAGPGCLAECAADSPPVAGIFTPVTHVCPGSFVPFIDNSLNEPTSWDWTFSGGSPSTSTFQNPLVKYDDIGTFSATLSVENSLGFDFADATIQVDENGTKYLIYETFENGLVLWNIENPDNSITWSLASVNFANYGSNAAFINNFNYDSPGQNDYLVSPVVDLTLEGNVMLEIDYAYARYNSANSDRMLIEVSTNGGNTYPFTVFTGQENGSGNFATVADQTSAFSPSSNNDWCYGTDFGADCITVDLSQFSGEANFRFRIRNETDFGNNLYVDNIRLSSSCQIAQPPQANFSADFFVGCAPLPVQFMDESIGPVTDRQWTFDGGDPPTSTEADPFVVYDIPGSYDVTLQAGNPAGFSIETKEDFVIVLGPPVAEFEASVDGLEVSFTNLTTGATSYEWDFGDGNNSTEENPTHLYEMAGDYTVVLTAENECGEETFELQITVESPLTAAFSVDTTMGCVPFSIQFTDESEGDIQSWKWTFEGGMPDTSTAQNPMVEYQNAGTFMVQLIVSDGMNTDTLEQLTYIQADTLPTADFDYIYTLGQTEVMFMDSSLNADSLFWDFGDGNTSSEMNPTNDYSNDSTYTVTLIAINACGADTLTQDIQIVTLPKGSITADTTSGCIPLTVQFASNSPNGESFEWIFEGGTPDTSTLENPTVLYEEAGTFDVILIVTNAAGQLNDTMTAFITVLEPPTASFDIDYTLGNTNATFNNTSTGADSYSWDFGDGNTSTEESPMHDYGMDGTYTVTLIATNACGSDTTMQDIEIVTNPDGSITADTKDGCVPLTVNFSSNSTNGVTYAWTFDGGTPSTSSEADPIVVYNTAGTFSVSLVITNAAGDTSLMEMDYITVGEPPTASFDVDYTLGNTNATFNNTSTGADSYSWDFGDGNTSTEESPMHDYGMDGMYAVILIATNACGSDTTMQDLQVVTSPDGSISVDLTDGCTPLTVNFSSNSTNGATYAWTFDGGMPSTSTDADPTVVYNTAGTFSVSLVITNAAGEISLMETDYITVGEPPTASFDVDYTLGNTNATFNNTSTGADSYSWDFGDGNTSTEESPMYDYGADGTYTVTLIATNACGSDTTMQDLQVVTSPDGSISADVTDGCTPLTVNFSSNSTNGATYAWTFDGGMPSTSTDANPTVVYNTAGTFSVSLVITNAAGEISLMETDYITVGEPPTASFNIDYTLGNTNATFNNTSTGADSYSWDFGDGNTSTEESPMHDYGMDGTYTVTLVVMNACGSDTTMQDLEVVTSPDGSISADVTDGCTPLTVNFSSNSTNGATYAWTFDGGMPSTSTAENPTVVYNTVGTFSVSLVITNAAGEISLMETDYITVGEPPTASFNIDYTLGNTNATFNNTSTGADSYFWDFGDGNTSTEESPMYDYGMDGVYTVTLIATNACGSDTTMQDLQVVTSPDGSISADVTDGCTPLTVNFSSNSTNGATYAWTFDGGTPSTSTAANPTVVYNTAGTFSVSLVITNAAGEISLMETDYITVGQSPIASFDIDYTVGNTDATFVNTSTAADSYFWDFGNGNTNTEESPMYDYGMDGTYTVTLIAMNACGSDTTMQDLQVVTSPDGSISADVTDGCTPLTVNFSSNSTNGATYAWTFDGGMPSTSTAANPTVVYNTAGTFSVSLVITNAAGEISLMETDYITVGQSPIASFDIDYTVGNTNATFVNTSTAADSYFWDFGDGNTSTEESPMYDYGMDGTYTVTLIATNVCGSDTTMQDLQVVTSPDGSISADVTDGCTPLVVNFSSNSTNGATYAWTFDGGMPSTSTEADPTVVYNTAGTFSVSLVITNAAGEISLMEMDYITVGALPIAAFQIDYQIGENNIDLINLSSEADSYEWHFGDGSISTEENPSHEYGTDGIYIIQLIAQNECGADTISNTIEIITPPQGAITSDQEEGCVPFTVQFFANSTNADSFNWTFEGGNPATSTDENPIVAYENAGLFDVSLILTNEAGETSIELTDAILVEELPLADFDIEVDGLDIILTNNSINADTYFWDFGDNTTSEEEVPTHSYTEPGEYTVSLLVENDCGVDTLSQSIVVMPNSLGEVYNNVELEVFPNPNKGAFWLQVDGLEGIYPLQITVYNVAGQLIQSTKQRNQIFPLREDYNWSNLSAGLYIIQVEIEGQIWHKRLIVQD